MDSIVATLSAGHHRPGEVGGRAFNVVTDHDTIGNLAGRCMAAVVNLERPGCKLIVTEPRTAEVGHVRMTYSGRSTIQTLRPSVTLAAGIPATARAMLEGR